MADGVKRISYVVLLLTLVYIFFWGITYKPRSALLVVNGTVLDRSRPRAHAAPSTGQLLAGLVSTALFSVAMEYYARHAHKHWWHGDALWWVHVSHHTPGKAAFENNDAFGVLNAAVVVPIMFFTWHAPPSYFCSLVFGACTGISAFGTAYIVVHDGIHHRRFWTGPLDGVACLRAIADAHKQHHTKEHTEPFGLFLGPQELQAKARGVAPRPMPTAARAALGAWLVATACSHALGL